MAGKYPMYEQITNSSRGVRTSSGQMIVVLYDRGRRLVWDGTVTHTRVPLYINHDANSSMARN